MEIIEFLTKIISERLGKEAFEKLINKPDKHGQSSLYLAAWKGHAKMVAFLLNLKETDINMANEKGMTSLLIACDGGHLEVVKV